MKTVTELVKDSKHFCILPWIHFHAWPNSQVMPCCVADSTMPVSQIKKDESIIQMMNSEDYKKMRLSMLNDKPVEACTRCYDLEKTGNWTLRQSHNTRRGLENIDAVEATNDDGSIDEFKMKYMDIRFSNLCNMKCRSCGPSCSSLWAKEYIEYEGMEKYEKHFKTKKFLINNNADHKFMNKLLPYLKDVEEVYFAGGEIIITPEHYECLDYWIENGQAEQIELSYTTNFSVLKYKDKDLIDYWKKFPKLQIWASLDAAGDVAEIIRKGTDWDKIVKNIKTLKELVPHAKFQITPTISIWNVFDFPEFFDFLIENDFIDTTTSPRFNTASSPWYANIMILPDDVKRDLIKLYATYINKYSHNADIVSGFRVIQQTLKSGHLNYGGANRQSYENKGGILEFKKFNDELDQYRDEKLEDIIPELKAIYAWAASDAKTANPTKAKPVRKIISIDAPEPYLAITWQVNNFCNFKCSYCNPGNWGGTDRNDGNLDLYISNLSTIIQRYQDLGYKQFKFFFSGGEPTAWKNFIPICEWLKFELPNCTLAVNTNLSRPLAWWKKNYHLFDDIVASFHVEFADKAKYEENSIFLCDKVNYLSSKMLMHEERFWEVVEFGEHLKTVMPNYVIEWTPLFDEMSVDAGPWEYADQDKVDFINSHNVEKNFTVPKPFNESKCVSYNKYQDGTIIPTNSNEVIVNGENFFRGWNCNVGDAVFINPIGNISLASCGQGGNVGHILNDISKVGPKQIICGKSHCHCGTDIIIPKTMK